MVNPPGFDPSVKSGIHRFVSTTFPRKPSLGQRLGQAYEVLRNYVNEAAPRAVNVRYKKERDGDNQRQNEKQAGVCLSAPRTIADQQVAADGDRYHQTPRRRGNAVPPCRLGVSLRVQRSEEHTSELQSLRHL